MTQSPSFACAGDSITVSCVQTVPNAGAGDLFDSSRPNFIIGTTNLTLTESTVNGNGSANGFDLSRFTVDTNPGNFTEVTGSITLLSYIKDTDEGLRIGCANYYRSGGAGGPIILVQALTLLQAGMFVYTKTVCCLFERADISTSIGARKIRQLRKHHFNPKVNENFD